MPLDRKKKREERFEIENLLTSIRGEFGDEVKVARNQLESQLGHSVISPAKASNYLLPEESKDDMD